MRIERSLYYYRPHRDRQEGLRTRFKELSAARPTFGYLRLHMLLRREGWRVNRKRVYRLYREEGLQVRTKKRRKKIATRVRAPQSEATSRDERWSMDFVSDQLVGGRRFRVLTLVDLYSRECLALRAGFSLKGGDVADVLDGLKRNGRKPKLITVDNGSEFTSKELDTWSYLNDVKLDFIRPGKPVESCYIESFDGKLRDDDNHVRPHRSLGGVPPSYRGEQITHGVPNPDFSI